MGNPIVKDLNLKIKTAFTGYEIFSEQISTMSNEGLLETKGMLEINAFHNDRPLSLSENKSIDIFFPGDPINYEGAQTFYGVEDANGTIKWEEDKQTGSLAKNKSLFKQETELTFKLEHSYYDGLAFDKGFFLADPSMQDSLRDWLDLSERQKKTLMDNFVVVHWILFSDGDFETFEIQGNISNSFKKLLERKFNNFPMVQPFKRHNDDAPVNGKLFLGASIKVNELSKSFSLKVYDLGWVNCDIFLRIKEPLINMVVKAPNSHSLMKIVFNEYKTVISGLAKSDGNVYFEGIPQNAKIKIVTLYSENDETMLSITGTTIKEEISTLNEFKAVDKQAFEKEINTILHL